MWPMLGWLSDTASLQKSNNLLITQWPCNSKVFSRISVILHALALADKEVPIYHKRFPLGCSLSLNGTKNSSKVPFFTTKKASVFHLTFVFAIVFAFLFQPKTTLQRLLTTQNTVALFIQHLCLHQNENRSRTGLGDVGRRWPTEEFVRNPAPFDGSPPDPPLHQTRPWWYDSIQRITNLQSDLNWLKFSYKDCSEVKVPRTSSKYKGVPQSNQNLDIPLDLDLDVPQNI